MEGRYLLKCDSDELGAWKRAASSEGVSLARWLRDAANQRLAGDGGRAAVVEHALALRQLRDERPAGYSGGKRSFTPDPKNG